MAKDLRLPLPSDAQHPAHSQNIIMGRAADPWRVAETWIRCLASHCVPLHAKARLSTHPDLAHLTAEPGIWDRYGRSCRSRSAIRQASCSRPRLDRASCPTRHQGAGRLPLQAHRAIVDLAPIAAILLSYRTPRRQLDYGRSTTFTVSLEGVADTQAEGCCEPSCAPAPGRE
jgi:hypothetical protein